jgi:bifunctional DNA-binding transcriptional regulator/antitoxin component of YhaV-PrlF toxin-antitoxin module
MLTVKISSKYQITITKEFRKHIKPGQKLRVFQIGNRIVMLPVRSIKESRGFLKGIDTNVKRERV